MSHTTFFTFAVAVTVTPPAEAVRVIGPHERSSAPSIHNHVGNPINDTAVALGNGVAPTVGGTRFIESTASRASSDGFTRAGAEPAQNQVTPPLIPTPVGPGGQHR